MNTTHFTCFFNVIFVLFFNKNINKKIWAWPCLARWAKGSSLLDLAQARHLRAWAATHHCTQWAAEGLSSSAINNHENRDDQEGKGGENWAETREKMSVISHKRESFMQRRRKKRKNSGGKLAGNFGKEKQEKQREKTTKTEKIDERNIT